MFKILNGREHFFQWDTNQKLIVEDDSILELHFYNGTGRCSLVCRVYDENGLRIADVPNSILQDNMRVKVYGYTDTYTKIEKCFEVCKRSKPDDYVYTETELKRYEALEDRVEALENEIDIDEIIELTPTSKNIYKPVPAEEWFDGYVAPDFKNDDYVYCIIPVESGKEYTTSHMIENPTVFVNKDDKEGFIPECTWMDMGYSRDYSVMYDLCSYYIPEGYNYLMLCVMKINWGEYKGTLESIVNDFNSRFMLIEGKYEVDELDGIIYIDEFIPYTEGYKIKDEIIVPGADVELTPEDKENIKADVIAAVEPEVKSVARNAAGDVVNEEIELAKSEISFTIPYKADLVSGKLSFKSNIEGRDYELFTADLPSYRNITKTSELVNDSKFITEAKIPEIAEAAAALIDAELLDAIGGGVLE